jgi:hypothetical protein
LRVTLGALDRKKKPLSGLRIAAPLHRPVAVSPQLVYHLGVALEKPRMNENTRGEEMATSQDAASVNADMAEHERTYRGFILMIKLSAAVTVTTLLLLYFFLAR